MTSEARAAVAFPAPLGGGAHLCRGGGAGPGAGQVGGGRRRGRRGRRGRGRGAARGGAAHLGSLLVGSPRASGE